MKANVYIQPEISPSSGYVYIDLHKAMLEEEIEENYKRYSHLIKETLEGYKLRYILLTIKYDGRKRRIEKEDVMKAMEKEGLVTNTGTGSIFGNFYLPTNKLKEKLATINHRKDRVT